MGNNTEKTELETLQNRLAENPNSSKVLTDLAFYYLENPDGRKELEFFEKAYLVNPTLENTHNYAFWVSYEYGKDDLAIPLQQHVLTMNPHSHYPYLAYAQALIDENWDKPYSITTLNKLIEMYQMAIEKVNAIYSKSDSPFLIAKLLHNLGICYMLLGDNPKVEQYFSQALTMGYSAIYIADDVREEAIYNLMLDFTKFHIINEQPKRALYWLEQASLSSQKDNLDIADLYGRLGDFEQAYDWMKDDFNSYQGYDWAFMALHKYNLSEWKNYYQDKLEDKQDMLQYGQQELKNAQQADNKKEILENQAYIANTLEEINALEKILTDNIPVKPKELPIYREFYFNHFGCLLFGCQKCGNLKSDNQN